MNRKLYIITPVYNEEPNLQTLVEGWNFIQKTWKEYEIHFILVDDGSTDKTGEIATKLAGPLNFKLISHTRNMGPGYAFGAGFEYLFGIIEEKDIVVTIEGDNTSRLETLKLMLGRIEREGVDVAFASPLSYGGSVTNTVFYRRVLGHTAAALTKIVLNIHGINTFTSFFRAYQGHVIIELQKKYGKRILEFNGFECMVELLKKITLLNFSISEVPMNLDTSLRKGKSKLNVWKTGMYYFVLFKAARKW
jgi:dolichol-phosphate mannosyltransferase